MPSLRPPPAHPGAYDHDRERERRSGGKARASGAVIERMRPCRRGGAFICRAETECPRSTLEPDAPAVAGGSPKQALSRDRILMESSLNDVRRSGGHFLIKLRELLP